MKTKNDIKKNCYKDDDIAVIGIGFKIAGTDKLQDYWNIFENNIDCIRDLPEERKNDIEDYAKIYTQLVGNKSNNFSFNKAGYLDTIDKFDHEFFKIAPLEAQVMDPIQRILLETIYNAFDDAGYTKEELKGTKTGIYIGYTPGSMKDNYSTNIFYNNPELIKYSNVGNMPCIVPSRASYALNLNGPTMVIDSACSSSLVAIHDACVSIKTGTCSMAIAGGIRLHSFPIAFDDMNVGFETDDNKTRTFDDSATGAAIGEGSAVILLKSLKEAERDKDNIYGVIKGSAVNNDGTSASITAPNPAAQKQVLLDAFKDADITPDMIDYIETHGTATALGDPIEFRGLSTAFGKTTSEKQFCALSSSKSNIGHLYEAAGVASVIKAIAAIKNKKIPGSCHFNVPNLKIDFCDSPFYINTQTKEWEKEGLRTCGISAFGISGTNSHLVLQEYNNEEAESTTNLENLVIGLSANSMESLVKLINNYKEYLSDSEVSIDLFASNVNLYRNHYQKRVSVVFSDKNELINILIQLSKLDQSEWKNISGVYFDPNESKEKIDYGNLRLILKNYNQHIKDVMNGQPNGKYNVKKDLNRIAADYSKGAKVDWNAMYKEVRPRRISLPYYPFKQTRCWLPKNNKVRDIQLNKIEEIDLKDEKNIIDSDFYYERTFIQGDNVEVDTNLSQCLLIEDHSTNDDLLFKELEKSFHKVSRLTFNYDEAKIKGPEKYFSEIYNSLDLSEFSHVVFESGDFSEVNRASENYFSKHKIQLLSLVGLYREMENYDHSIKISPLINSCFKVSEQEEFFDSNGATIFGLSKSFNRMFKNIHSCCIDLDKRTKLSTIVNEICSKTDKDIIAYRDNKRFYEGLSEVAITHLDKKPEIKDGGVYVISGGLGGIGFETALEMTNRAKDITLILLGRTGLMNTSGNEVSEKTDKLNILKEKAKNVHYYSVDIADIDLVSPIIQEVSNTYGRINGLIHAAGVSGGISFDRLNEEYLNDVMRPKILGTNVLDHVTRDQDLDFFVMFSSISTIFSSSDLPGYVAGNIYLDSYSNYREKETKSKSITINWATWSETGMAVRDNFTVDTLFQTIKTREAIKALFDTLNGSSGSVVIAQLNLKDKISMLLKSYPLKLSNKIQNALDAEISAGKRSNASDLPRKNNQYGEIERVIIEVCCKNLGYEDINIHHNFFELGANSILLSIILKDLDEYYPGLLQVTDLFSYPSVSLLAEHISNLTLVNKKEEIKATAQSTSSLESQPIEICDKDNSEMTVNNFTKSEKENLNSTDLEDSVAIIGVGLDLPNAKDLDSYWDMLVNGMNAVKEIPKERSKDITNHLLWQGYSKDKIKYRRSGYLDEINQFDNSFFGISPRDASLLEPVLRKFLECTSNAIDDSGYGADGIKGTNTGVFLGYTANLGNSYNKLMYEVDPKLFSAALPIGQVSMTASRTAYKFDLKGPSLVVDTACSSSLVALHMACEQIKFGKCDMALAGGASLMGIPLDDGSGIGFESPEEKTRAFSDNSSGSAIAEGVGVVLLKSLKKAQADGDSIYAVIKGSAINQDGSSFGIAAPNYLAQSEVIKKAWDDAGISAEDISYIEAHGTGTQLGDPIEIKGITTAFESVSKDKQICGVGSVKTNIGHANEAAGMCGLFKCILSLKNKIIPPTLNFQEPNPNIDFINSPLYVVDKLMPLQSKKEKAILGISGFGMSGTNAHLIIEEAPPVISVTTSRDVKPKIFTISANTEKALFKLIDRYREYLNKADINLYNLSATLNVGRRHYSKRIAFTYKNQSDLIRKLDELAKSNSLVSLTQDWYFKGEFAVVPENKKEKFSYEITLNEQRKLTEEAQELYQNLKDKEISQVLQLYVMGAEIDWKFIYNAPYRKLNLPTYPYDKKAFWYKLPNKEEAPNNSTEDNKDLIENNNKVLDSYFYSKKWVEQEILEANAVEANETIMIVHNEISKNNTLFSDKLKLSGCRVIDIYPSVGFKVVNEDSYHVGTQVDDYRKLFTALSNVQLHKIVHFAAYHEPTISEVKDLNKELDNSFFIVINLTKGLMKARIDNNIEYVLIGCNAQKISGREPQLYPINSVSLSVGRVIEQEYPTLKCRAIDTDMESSVESLIKVISGEVGNNYFVGIRDNKSYVEELYEKSISSQDNNRIVPGGTYIITGGTSGIGLKNALLFSRKAKCNLILLSRKGFPSKSEWRKLADSKEYSLRINDLEEILENGCNVEVHQCDISNENDVKGMLVNVRSKYNKVNGVVHCAGVIDPGFIIRKSKSSYLSVFAPKIMGTFILDKLTKDERDFLLLHSSNVTDVGEPGQSCYIGANAFLDSFTDYSNLSGNNTFTVNWVAWKETGMAYNQGTNVDTTTKAITTEEALDSLYQLISGKPQRTVIGQFNEKEDLLAAVKGSRNRITQKLMEKIYILSNRHNFGEVNNPPKEKILVPDKTKVQSEVVPNVTLLGSTEGVYTPIEKQIGKIYCDLLEYDEVDIYEGFFEMGGDSILLTEMHEIIDQLYPGVVKVADLFEFDSIHSLAEYISSNFPEEISGEDQLSANLEPEEFTLIGRVEDNYTSVEKQIGLIYCKLLEYDELDIYEGFFEMGGDSILLTEMHEAIENIYPNVVKVADLFEFDSIHSLSEFIENEVEIVEDVPDKAITEEKNKEDQTEEEIYYEMSAAQERIYYDYRLNKDKLTYNTGFVTDESNNTYENLVKNANKFFAEFDMFRTSFESTDNGVMQRVNPISPIEVNYVKVESLEGLDYKKYLKEFKLSKYPLFNLTFIESPTEKVMLFDVHHILLDGYSITVLQEHMHAFGKGEKLEKPLYPYSKYIEFERGFYESKEYTNMRDYWLEQLSNFDFSNPFAIREGAMGSAHSTVIMDNKLADNLLDFAKENGSTIYNLMLSAYKISLSQLTGKKDIAVVTPTLNRYKPEFKNCVGVFTNLIPLRTEVNMDSNLLEFIGNVTKVTREGLKNQFYQFNHLMDDLRQFEPSFQYYMDFEDKSLKKHRETKDIPHSVNIPKFYIDLEIKNLNNSFYVTAAYKEKYVSAEEIKYLLESFFKILELFLDNSNKHKTVKQITEEIQVFS
ncbi:SDR family NAD(P)-dependent oxidoreductase (plasmid) [Alkalihalophilus pseudofirmus]|uniref:SDR family NAD(P)-dependent oxidoreductase n=1 Tax=Alkalihalophilus pseudofirmus TaxID=79885 RepID=UPI00259AFE43|nr:SDR family NAD(P)-dependent oxidoreductase [Alkalihalophilus pseudofirmus]WEG19168.1 SDR family NAD(P)-dependent oxidoreductase [Alkalihalophilus pseudofirmus]